LYLLALPLDDLKTHLQKEVLENPLLDDSDDDLEAKIKSALASKHSVPVTPRFASRAILIDPSAPLRADARVEINRGRVIVKMNARELPRLHISSTYKKLLLDPQTSNEVKSFIKDRLKHALETVELVKRRQATLDKAFKFVLQSQQAALLGDPSNIKPLTLKDVANHAGIHLSTASRLASGKYVLLPNGRTLALKEFLNPSFKSGSSLSNKSVRIAVLKTIKDHDGPEPLTDSKTSRILQQKGIPISRRTVAKYRSLFGIPPSFDRKAL
jgi:RNA polymerase sigma-54 factor